MPRGLRDDDADDHEKLGLSAHGHDEEDDDVGATESPTTGILLVNLGRKVAARRRWGLFFLRRSRCIESKSSGPRLSMPTSATNIAAAANPKTTTTWKDQIEFIIISANLLDAVVTIVLVPLRVGFWFDSFNDPLSGVMWTRGLTVFAIIDFFGEAVRLWQNAARDGGQAPCSRLVSHAKSFRIMTFRQPSKIFPADASARDTAMTGGRDEVTLTQTLPLASENEQNRVASTCFSTRNLVLVAIGYLPLELVSVLERTSPDVVESRIAPRVDGRKASTHDFALRKLMDKLNKDAENSIKYVASWRLPRSAFRTRWRRARIVLLLFIGIEVPYQISFHRGFALFHTDKWAKNASFKETTILMVVDFFGNVVVEVFFYVDWYFTAACFVRSVYDGDQSNSSSSNDSQKQLQAHELIVGRSRFFGITPKTTDTGGISSRISHSQSSGTLCRR